PTFMHRLSAMDDPDAPLGHHWQDSTHITFGVITAGLAHRNLKLEGSVFTGREPDENRYDFAAIRLHSYSGRLSWNPRSNLRGPSWCRKRATRWLRRRRGRMKGSSTAKATPSATFES